MVSAGAAQVVQEVSVCVACVSTTPAPSVECHSVAQAVQELAEGLTVTVTVVVPPVALSVPPMSIQSVPDDPPWQPAQCVNAPPVTFVMEELVLPTYSAAITLPAVVEVTETAHVVPEQERLHVFALTIDHVAHAGVENVSAANIRSIFVIVRNPVGT